MIPALANYVVAMFKETPLLSVITVVELMARARGVASSNFRYLEPMTLVGCFFLLVSIVSVATIRLLERRLGARFKLGKA
jgi:polar amino acid transport system permease protein